MSLTGLAGNGGASAPTGAAGGDLSGTYPSPTVTNLSHVTNASLTDAGIAALAASKLTGNIPGSWLGTSGTTAAAGTDSRLSDARTPLTHAASHASGGGDPITVADALITAVSASKLTGSHTLPDGTLSTNVPLLASANTFTAAQLATFAATPNSGEWNAGSGPFDGSTTGFFTGSASGTKYAANAGATFAGNFEDYQTQGVSRFKVDYQGNLTLPALPVPIAPTLALAGAGAGSITNGTHVVAVTFVNANGETTIGASSASINVTDNTTNGKLAVSGIPLGTNGVTSRKLYMSKAGTSTPLFLVATIADNTTTTATLNTADGSLSATQPPGGDGSAGKLTFGSAFSIKPDGTGWLTQSQTRFAQLNVQGALTMNNNQNLQMGDGGTILFGATTGLKVGAATTSKLAFFNSTPVAQPSVTGALSTVTDAAAKAVLTSIIAALKASGLGLVADGTS